MKKLLFAVFVLSASFLLYSQDLPVVEPVVPAENEKNDSEIKKLAEQVEQIKKESELRDKELQKNRSEMEILKEELKKIKEEKNKEQAVEKLKKKLDEDKKPEKAVIFKPYGFFELYGYMNDAHFFSNELMVYVKDEKKSTANISARNTRLGLDISVPYINYFDLSAKLEIDFFGSFPDSGNAESSVGLRIRHGFFKLSKTFKSGTTLALLAGQTWATAIIPTFPSVINPAAGWGAGNPWNRLPLAELALIQKVGKIDIGLKIAVAKPISGASSNRKSFVELNIDSGDASHWPSLQSQLFAKSDFSMLNFYWVAAGAYGRENYIGGIKINGADTPTYGNEVEVWIFNTALKLDHKYAEIQGKFFIGENLDMFGIYGGSLVFKDPVKKDIVIDSMRAMGYWAELSLKPFTGMRLSTGFGAELFDHDQAIYSENNTFWISAFYTLFNHFTTGFEWQNTVTLTDDKKLTGNSFMGSLKFSF